MRHHLPSDGSVYLEDVTSSYTALCVMGPKSKDTMSKLTDVDLSTSAFPYFTCRHMDVSWWASFFVQLHIYLAIEDWAELIRLT